MAYRGEYDPWQHAEQLGVHVMTGVLGGNRWGEYRDHERVVVLRPSMSERLQRCTLAHELVHAERHEHVTGDHRLDARQERRADRLAAERLISWPAYVRACQLHHHQKSLVAAELGVTRALLRAYEHHLAASADERSDTA